MDAGLLATLFGPQPTWHGPCTVLLDADASVRPTGPDSIANGGTKVYAPRYTSGRVQADAILYSPSHKALFVVQQQRRREATGRETVQQTLLMVNVSHVVGLEFDDAKNLARLGLPAPVIVERHGFDPDVLVG